MVENRFSLRQHVPYLLLPLLLTLLYVFGMLRIEPAIFKQWLYDSSYRSELPEIHYMNTLNKVIRGVFILQALFVLIANFVLLHKYKDKAKQYYSDLQENQTRNIFLLNLTLVITAFSSMTLSALGKYFFLSEEIGLILASFIFSPMLFLIGWLGFKQKNLHPIPENITQNHGEAIEELSSLKHKQLLNHLTTLFKEDKLYLNPNLTIQDVALAVGTNRTYISVLINQHFHQNFCSFVNDWRIEALTQCIQEHPDFTTHSLAEACGFGSVDSMKRAVLHKTGRNFQHWKREILTQRKN
jgi:AraC-like DNA-binding protein